MIDISGGFVGLIRSVDSLDMPLQGEYEPSRSEWVREQVDRYERSAGTEANTLRDTGLPIIIVTMCGHKTGKIRKIALLRVEHDGAYAFVASHGGAPTHPDWYYNLKASPTVVMIQDGPEPFDVVVHEAVGSERQEWWDRAAAVYPRISEYEAKTSRKIPLFVAGRRG